MHRPAGISDVGGIRAIEWPVQGVAHRAPSRPPLVGGHWEPGSADEMPEGSTDLSGHPICGAEPGQQIVATAWHEFGDPTRQHRKLHLR